MIGVAYINNCTAKPSRNVMSRYLVVKELKMMPMPNPMPAISRTRNGAASNHMLGATAVSVAKAK